MDDMQPTFYPPPPQRRGGGGTSPTWIILAMVVGFMLPVCACGILTLVGVVSLGSLTALVEEGADTGEGAGVGVIDLKGVIVQGDTVVAAASDNLIRDIEWMNDNSDVKAILIRANSPGGDANASDIIWQALDRVDKPVVISVNGLCASGCYYIAMAGTPNEIYATPNSLIGSIGVISTFFNVQELADDIGIQVQVIATGENKDFGSPFRPLTEEEEAYWREQIAVILDTFISKVVAGRPNLSEGDIRELANGRVWTASIAQENGLIDGIKYESEAMDRAAELGGLKAGDYRIIETPFEPDFWEILLAGSPGFSTKLELPSAYDLINAIQQGPIQYRYLGPYGGFEE
jgi:protease-4